MRQLNVRTQRNEGLEMSHPNPFANAIKTFDLVPDKLRPRFYDALIMDWDDLVSNANPIEHTAADNADEAADYVRTFDYAEDDDEELRPNIPNPDDVRAALVAHATAFDLIADQLPDDEETTFGGERVSLGQYIDPEELTLPLNGPDFQIVVTMQDEEQTEFRFHIEDGVVTFIGKVDA